MTRPHPAHATYQLSPLNEGHKAKDGRFVRVGGRKRKVAIVGAGLGRHVAPLMTDDWEVWALNLVVPLDAKSRLRASRWFDIHQRVAQTEDDLLWIARCPVPIYVPPDLMDAGPNCVAYPLHEAIERFGARQFACTFSYQIALALLEGFEEIGLFGVELRVGTPRERTVEWASVSWWMGYAQAVGARVTVPSDSWLGRHPKLYGFEYQAEIDAVNDYLDFVKAGDEHHAVKASVGG